ncbi:MAG: hypothetical protein HY420_02310 [Candidatus Kerfeldbacteria bacterium]|nr:hypothetical protein [Candidatus Kerfeldbacteria bacterium]
MPNNRPIVIVVLVSLALIAVLLGIFFWSGSRPTPIDQGNKNLLTNPGDAASNVTDLLFSKTDARPDDRIVLFGGSLSTGNVEVLRPKLESALAYQVEIQSQPNINSRQALTALTPIFRKPPKIMILDIIRYDGASDIPFNETSSNLALLLTKFRQAGVRTVVLGGIGSDGNTQLAARLKQTIERQGTFVDASILLLSAAYRSSTTELNKAGAEKLSEELIKALRPSPSS